MLDRLPARCLENRYAEPAFRIASYPSRKDPTTAGGFNCGPIFSDVPFGARGQGSSAT